MATRSSLGGRHVGRILAAAFCALLWTAAWTPAASPADPSRAAATQQPSVRRIVLDPGHGGAEDGAIGPEGLKEKELVLDVAQRLAELLRGAGFEVLLTREGDTALGLDARAEIANTKRADLFISLHANASRFAKASGAETYLLAREATDDSARAAAAIENNAAGLDAPLATQGGDVGADDADQNLPLILWDLAQSRYLAQSARLAETIQGQLNAALGIADRGVKQAPFRVLVGATSPAVLVELGFLTNPEEEKLLATVEYREKLAIALNDAIKRYREQVAAP